MHRSSTEVAPTLRGSRVVAAALATGGLSLCVAAPFYAALASALDPKPPLLEATARGVREARLVLLLLGLGLLLLARLALHRPGFRSERARGLAARTTLAIVFGVLPLVALEIAGRPIEAKTTIFVPDERLGWRHRPGAEDAWLGVPVRINAKGLRGPELDHRKPRGVRRLLYLGDSVTFGALVADTAQTFPYRVEGLLEERGQNTVETVNAGVGGYSPWQERLYLEDEGLRYEPDLVVVSFVMNDVLEEAFLSDVGFLPHRYQLRRTASSPWDRLARRSGLVRLATLAGRALAGGDQGTGPGTGLPDLRAVVTAGERPDVARAWQTTLAALDRLFGACRERGIPALLVVVPLKLQLEEASTGDAPQRLLREFARERSLPYLDLLPALARDESAPTYFLDDTHLTARGHAQVAEALADFMLEARLLG